MEEPTNVAKIGLLRQLKTRWINTNYTASQEAHIGKVLGEPQMVAQAVELMRRAMTAVDELDKALAELVS